MREQGEGQDQDAERRLSAIISGDVVGYSRLMSDNEEETVRRVNQYREEIELLVQQHRGRLVDFTGDNFLAEFSSSVRAVECAVEIQNVMHARNRTLPKERRMSFRLGIHQADVRVGGERVYGTGVNVASRLEGLAEPGGICISAAVRDQFEGRLHVEFEDIGEREVKNIPRPLRVYRVHPREDSEVAPAVAQPPPRRRVGALVAVAFGLVVVVGGLLMMRGGDGTGALEPAESQQAPAASEYSLASALDDIGSDDDLDALMDDEPEYPVLPDRPSIVVLPFQNMSDDPQQDYFADGIAEDLTTDLSKVPQLFVIARNSAFTYKADATDIAQVGRELGVRYVVEGSTRKIGNHVRITSQLIDATTGFHVWSERYDREFADVFALQNEITQQILNAIGVKIAAAEAQRIRRKPQENLSAYESWLRGRSLIRRFTRKDQAEGRALLQRAIELDPNYAEAYALLGSAYMTEYMGWNPDARLTDLAEPLARRAMELSPESPDSLQAIAAVHIGRGEIAEALSAARLLIEIVPNDFHSLVVLGISQLQSGDPEAGVATLEGALRANPLEAHYGWTIVGLAYYQAGRTSEAVAAWERVRANNPDAIGDRIALAGHALSVDDLPYARKLIQEILDVNPDYSGEHAREWLVRAGLPPEEIDLAIGQLQRAGLPSASVGS